MIDAVVAALDESYGSRAVLSLRGYIILGLELFYGTVGAEAVLNYNAIVCKTLGG